MIEHRIESGKPRPGTRVRLLEPTHGLKLEVTTGSIVRPDKWEGYYIIRLDQPAWYESEELQEIREAWDNLEILDGGDSEAASHFTRPRPLLLDMPRLEPDPRATKGPAVATERARAGPLSTSPLFSECIGGG